MSPTPRQVPDIGSRLGRRAVLIAGAGASLAAVGGCTLNNPFDTAKTPAAQALEDLAPDVALAVTAVGALLEADARAHLVVKEFPGLRSRVAGVIALHAAHLEALEDAVPEGVDPRTQTSNLTPPATQAAALQQQHSAEHELHERLVGLALRAESGPFARLLGSMAAAISQELTAHPLLKVPR